MLDLILAEVLSFQLFLWNGCSSCSLLLLEFSRSAENKMDSSNLSVILAPNLLHSGDGGDKMNANTEKRLRLQAAVIRAFIENSKDFGTAVFLTCAERPCCCLYNGHTHGRRRVLLRILVFIHCGLPRSLA